MPRTIALGLFAATGALVMLLQSQRFSLPVPAKSMKARADLVRTDLISKYLVPAKDYPLAAIFHSASMIPTDRRVIPVLLARGGGVFKVTKDPAAPTVELTNIASTALDVPLNALLQDQVIRITLKLPASCVLKASWGEPETLTITPKDASSAIAVTFEDVLTQNGIPLPLARTQRVDSLTVSGKAINLLTTGVNGMGLNLTLDLTQ